MRFIFFFFRMPFDANVIDWSSKVLKNDVFGVQRGHSDDNAKLLWASQEGGRDGQRTRQEGKRSLQSFLQKERKKAAD